MIHKLDAFFKNTCAYGAAILMWVVAHMPQVDNIAQQLAMPMGVLVGVTQAALNLAGIYEWLVRKFRGEKKDGAAP